MSAPTADFAPPPAARRKRFRWFRLANLAALLAMIGLATIAVSPWLQSYRTATQQTIAAEWRRTQSQVSDGLADYSKIERSFANGSKLATFTHDQAVGAGWISPLVEFDANTFTLVMQRTQFPSPQSSASENGGETAVETGQPTFVGVTADIRASAENFDINVDADASIRQQFHAGKPLGSPFISNGYAKSVGRYFSPEPLGRTSLIVGVLLFIIVGLRRLMKAANKPKAFAKPVAEIFENRE